MRDRLEIHPAAAVGRWLAVDHDRRQRGALPEGAVR